MEKEMTRLHLYRASQYSDSIVILSIYTLQQNAIFSRYHEIGQFFATRKLLKYNKTANEINSVKNKNNRIKKKQLGLQLES